MVNNIIVTILFCVQSLPRDYSWGGNLPIFIRVVYFFFERFPTTRPRLPHELPSRPSTDACMCMWGQLLPKTSHLEWPYSLVDREVYDLLVGVDHPVVLELV